VIVFVASVAVATLKYACCDFCAIFYTPQLKNSGKPPARVIR
jgi:hypothetical protein